MSELLLKSCKCGCGMTFRILGSSKQEYAVRLHNPDYEFVYGERLVMYKDDLFEDPAKEEAELDSILIPKIITD